MGEAVLTDGIHRQLLLPDIGPVPVVATFPAALTGAVTQRPTAARSTLPACMADR